MSRTAGWSRRATTAITIDDRAWPRVAVRWPSGARRDDEVQAAIDVLRAVGSRADGHVVLVDAREASTPSPMQLAMLVALARSVAPTSHCAAVAIVSTSPALKVCVERVRALSLGDVLVAHFGDVAEANAWLETHAPGRWSRTTLMPGLASRRPSAVPRLLAS